MGAITTVDRVKRALRIPSGVTVHDAAIADVVEESEAEVMALVGLTSWDAATAYSETLTPRPGGDRLLLRRRCNVAVVALTQSGALLPTSSYEVGAGGWVRLVGGARWTGEAQEVSVTYTAGLVAAGATPADLRRAVTLHAARSYHLEPMAGLASSEVAPLAQDAAHWLEDLARLEVERYLSRYRD